MSKVKIKENSLWVNDDGDELLVTFVNKDRGVTYVHYKYVDDGISDYKEDGCFLWLFKPKSEPLTAAEAGL